MTSILMVTLMTPCSLDAVHVYSPALFLRTALNSNVPFSTCTLLGSIVTPAPATSRELPPLRVHLTDGGTRPSALQDTWESEPSSSLAFTGTGLNFSCSVNNNNKNKCVIYSTKMYSYLLITIKVCRWCRLEFA